MINHYWSFLLFLLKSKKRHGVHSAFVYELNDYFYRNTNWKKAKKWTFRLKRSSDVNDLFIKTLKAFISTYSPEISMKFSLYDASRIPLETILDRTSNQDEIIVVKSLYFQRKKWAKRTPKESHVMIDFYFWGLCCQRNQVSQHFLIRI